MDVIHSLRHYLPQFVRRYARSHDREIFVLFKYLQANDGEVTREFPFQYVCTSLYIRVTVRSCAKTQFWPHEFIVSRYNTLLAAWNVTERL
jgi:hypothetical protein